MASEFEIKPYPELWASPDMDVPRFDMDVPRFDKARLMLGEAYAKTYLSQKNRPLAHTLRGPK